MIDPVLNVFMPNEVKIHFRICDNSFVTFVIIGLCLVFSNTSHVDSLDKVKTSVVNKVNIYIRIFLSF